MGPRVLLWLCAMARTPLRSASASLLQPLILRPCASTQTCRHSVFPMISYVFLVFSGFLYYFWLIDITFGYLPYRLTNGLFVSFLAFYSALGSWLRVGPAPASFRKPLRSWKTGLSWQTLDHACVQPLFLSALCFYQTFSMHQLNPIIKSPSKARINRWIHNWLPKLGLASWILICFLKTKRLRQLHPSSPSIGQGRPASGDQFPEPEVPSESYKVKPKIIENRLSNRFSRLWLSFLNSFWIQKESCFGNLGTSNYISAAMWFIHACVQIKHTPCINQTQLFWMQ